MDFDNIFANLAQAGELVEMPQGYYLRGWGYLNKGEAPPLEFFNYLFNNIDKKINSLASIAGIWKPNEVVDIGYIRRPRNNPAANFYLLCTLAGTTSSTEPTWPGFGETQTDGSAIWEIKEVGSGRGSGLAIGTTIQHLGVTPPDGFLALQGQEVGRATYPELWDWVKEKSGLLVTEANWQTTYGLNSGNCGCYSEGDGNTTFRLPNITAFLRPKGDSSSNAGDYQGDAIRNLQGTFPIIPTTQWGAVSGVFKRIALGSGDTAPHSNNGAGIEFNASKVVPTAEENRPKNITILFCVKAFDEAVNQGTVDITELANDVSRLDTQKVNHTDFSQSLMDTGWTKLPNGLIMQWGAILGSQTNVVFPVEFPNAFFGGNVSWANASVGNSYSSYLGYTASSTTGLTIVNASVARFYVVWGY